MGGTSFDIGDLKPIPGLMTQLDLADIETWLTLVVRPTDVGLIILQLLLESTPKIAIVTVAPSQLGLRSK